MKRLFFCLPMLILSCVAPLVCAPFAYDRAVRSGQCEKWDTACSALKSVLVENSESPEVLYDVGVASYKTKQHEQALAYFNAASERSKAGSNLQERAFFNGGNAAFQLKNFVEAVSLYDAALRINPDNAHAQHNRTMAQQMVEQEKQKSPPDDKNQEDNKNQKKDDQKNNKSQDQNKDKGSDDQKGEEGDDGDQKQPSSESGYKKDQKKQKGKKDDQQKNKGSEPDDDDDQEGNDQEGDEGDQSSDDKGNEKSGKKNKQSQKNDPHKRDDKQKSQDSVNKKPEVAEKNDDKQQAPQAQEDKNGNEQKDEKGEGSGESSTHVDERNAATFAQVDAWVGEMLKKSESQDARLNKQLIRSTVEKQLVGQDGQNRW
jgi:Ca-activated chloride channel family protein